MGVSTEEPIYSVNYHTMETREFIKDAIKGGWRPWKYGWPEHSTKDETWRLHGMQLHLFCKVYEPDAFPEYEGPWRSSKEFWVHITQPLLDPKAWEAVGKTRGWEESGKYCCSVCGNGIGRDCDTPFQFGWTHYWHEFIDLLGDDKTIEDALAAIR